MGRMRGSIAFQIHPAILDACLQILGAAVAAQATENGQRGIYMPTRIDQIRVHGPVAALHLWSHAHLRVRGKPMPSREMCGCWMRPGKWRSKFWDFASNLLARHRREENLDDWLYEFQWQPKSVRQDSQPRNLPRPPAGEAG